MKLNKIMTVCALSFTVVGAITTNAAWAQNISGKIVNSLGQAIPNAEIKIANEKQRFTTDENGFFSITNVSAGKLELHVSAARYSHITEILNVAKSDVSGIEIKLSPTVMEVIDVHATPLHSSSIESALPVNVLSADELRLKQASTLGETLKNEVGVHSTYYGPVASSPIIRGLDGPRVLITQNGLDVGDASRVGPDHVVSSETSTATQIEVLRGPATLFYGSGAIGGVVNVVDNRVPTHSEQQLDYMLKHNDVADENEASLNLNTGSKKVALHLDGFWRESNDYTIPGFAELPGSHNEQEEHDDDHEDEHEEEGVKGKLENSASKSSGFTVGASYLLDQGFIGFSYGKMDREYGVPGHGHGDEHDEQDEHDEEGTRAKLKQDRFQLLSDLEFDDDVISRLSSKFAYTDYQHQEIEDGELGTQFKNQMLEARIDAYHNEYMGWKGAWTFHYKQSDFEAIGEEAFTPPSETESVALAWLEEKHYGDLLVQLGLRVEHVSLTSHAELELHDEHEELDDHEEATHFEEQSFNPVSASVGLVWGYQTGYNVGFSAAMSQRAPSAGELFSNGAHIGTNTYEVGALYNVHYHDDDGLTEIELTDQDVDIETSYSLDLTWRKFEGDFGFVISGFYNNIDDYFYQQNTGLFAEDNHEHGTDEEMLDEDEHQEELGLPIYVYQQGNVDMYGFESELLYQFTPSVKVKIFADYIRAKLSDGDNLPRIPPMRIGSEIDYQADNYSAALSISHYAKQKDTAQLESSTNGYTMVDANFNYYLDGIGNDMVLFVKGENLTDEDARVHASFLKNIAPLPGRAISVGIRGSF
ncbi:TonB-dependent receptor [Colwelliaceae bacterium 6471]